MLIRHPHIDVVWCHAGVDRRVAPDNRTTLLREMLRAHPRLHVDLSWAMADLIVPQGDTRPDPDWVQLVGDHPDRFVLGSDVFGDPSGLPDKLHRLGSLRVALPSTAGAAVAGENATRLWFA